MKRVGLLIALLAMISCSEKQQPTSPAESTVGDLQITLVAGQTAAGIADVFDLEIVAMDGSDNVAADLEYTWNWRSGAVYSHIGKGRYKVRLQLKRIGSTTVSVRVSKPGLEGSVDLEQDLTVTGGSVDGSLSMKRIPSGTYTRGVDPSQTHFSWNSPQQSIQLAEFEMATTEVTNQTFVDLISAKIDEGVVEYWGSLDVLRWYPPNHQYPINIVGLTNTALSWDGTGVVIAPDHALHPVTRVTWKGAVSFCNWLSEQQGLEPAYTISESQNPLVLQDVTCNFAANGYRLPTEAEWEKGARGGHMLASGVNPLPSRRFPWGDDDFERFDLQGETTGSSYANYDLTFDTVYGTLPVGSFPLGQSPYGLYDMLGNAAEWMWDWFDFDYYSSSPTADPHGPDDQYPGFEDWKSMRGGSAYGTYIGGLGAWSVEHRVGFRAYADWMRYYGLDTGFRLARTP